MTCALCGHDRPLKNSHFAPKHAYRRFGGMAAPGTSVMRSSKGKIFNSDRQITQNLLCGECECRFSMNGENYFAEIAMPSADQKTPPLLFRILRVTLIPAWNRMGVSRFSLGGGLYPEINSKAIYYYAISLFWRGGLDGWRDYEKMKYTDELNEMMKNFLLGGDYISGYIIRVIPSFWRQKYGFVLPVYRKNVPFFSMYMYDFYLEECPRNFFRVNAADSAPVFYTADSFASVETHCEMTSAINSGHRAKALQGSDDLISW